MMYKTLKIGDYEITDYCSICNSKLCDNFSFINIMYSKLPTILALAQLSLGKAKCLKISDEEYARLVEYNVRYISFLEELYTRYRKSLMSIQFSQFKFSVWACVTIDEMFHIFIKWFEKLIFWNRINSIKAKPCTYYKNLLKENIEFIFSLFVESIKSHYDKLPQLLNIKEIKKQFEERVLLTNSPKTNGDYFQHTERIKDNLFIYLESILFWILSIDRTQQENEPFLYVCPSMFIIDGKLLEGIFQNIINLTNKNHVNVKIVTKDTKLKSELALKVKDFLEEKNYDFILI